MKRIVSLVLSVIMLITLVGCSSNKEDGEKYYNKMKKVMEKNDSFQVNVYTVYTLQQKKINNQYKLFSFNEFYDENKKEGYQVSDSIVEMEMFLKNKKIFEKNNEGVKEMEDTGLFTLNYEFLHIKPKDIKSLKLSEMHKKKVLKIELDLSNTKKRDKYFVGLFDEDSNEEVIKANVEITLNKDSSIEESIAHYQIQTKEGILELVSQVTFINYGHQDIAFPEGI